MSITMSEKAFQKLLWFRKHCNENTVGNTQYSNPTFLEVSLMGISESEENLSHITDFICVKQECTAGTTELDDDGLAIFFDDMREDHNISAKRCGRIWAHTHPGSSPTPSTTDNDTWNKYFKDLDFAVMYILADGNDSCRVRYNTNVFGIQQRETPVYIVLDRKDAEGNAMVVSSATFFKFDKMFKDEEGYTDCARCFLFSSPAQQNEWMEELKRCVKKKSYQYSGTIPHNSHYGTTSGGTNHYNNGRYLPSNQTQTQAQAQKTETPKLTKKGLIKILVRNGKDNINQFDHSGIDEIVKALGCTRASIYDAQREVIACEAAVEADDLVFYKDLESEFLVIENGVYKNNVNNMPKDKLETLCIGLSVRKQKLIELVNDYIKILLEPKTI